MGLEAVGLFSNNLSPDKCLRGSGVYEMRVGIVRLLV